MGSNPVQVRQNWEKYPQSNEKHWQVEAAADFINKFMYIYEFILETSKTARSELVHIDRTQSIQLTFNRKHEGKDLKALHIDGDREDLILQTKVK